MLPLIAMAGVSVLQGILGGAAQRKQIKAQNKAAAQANALNTLEAFQGVSAIEVQRGAVRQQTAKTLALADRRAAEASSTVGAASAATGVQGASVDAVQNDIDRELGEVQGELEIQHINQEYTLNQRVRELVTGTRMSLEQMQDVPSSASILRGALLQGAMSAGSAYANQYFQFGSTGEMGAKTGATLTQRTSSGVQTFAAPDTAAGLTFNR